MEGPAADMAGIAGGMAGLFRAELKARAEAKAKAKAKAKGKAKAKVSQPSPPRSRCDTLQVVCEPRRRMHRCCGDQPQGAT